MSTLQETVKTVDEHTVTRAVVMVASVLGSLTLMFSAVALYSVFILVANEVLTNAGVFEEFTRANTEIFQLFFELPVLAVMGAAAARIVNILTEIDIGLKRAVTTTAGAWAFVAAVHIQLIQWGVM